MSLDWEPLILAVAPNGAYKTKRDHAALPMTSAAIAETAARCLEAGASMIHLHVRDTAGVHSLHPDTYREAIDAVWRAVGDKLVIQVTSEAAKRYTAAQQMESVRAIKPEAVSLAVRELVPDAASEPEAAAFFRWLVQEHVAPQYILYSEDDLRRYQDLLRREVIPDAAHWVLFVLGRYGGGAESQPSVLLPFLKLHDPDTPWAVCAFGRLEHACGVCAVTLGGHVRVGFENNLYLANGNVAEDNAALVAAMRDSVVALGCPLADADAVRARFAAS